MCITKPKRSPSGLCAPLRSTASKLRFSQRLELCNRRPTGQQQGSKRGIALQTNTYCSTRDEKQEESAFNFKSTNQPQPQHRASQYKHNHRMGVLPLLLQATTKQPLGHPSNQSTCCNGVVRDICSNCRQYLILPSKMNRGYSLYGRTVRRALDRPVKKNRPTWRPQAVQNAVVFEVALPLQWRHPSVDVTESCSMIKYRP